MLRRKNWIVLAVVLVLAGVALYQNIVTADERSAQSVEEAAKPGYRAPSFELIGLDGNTYKVGGERDRPVLINFWASWCGPCHIEAPDLQTLYEEYEGKLDLYSINVMSLDTRKGAEKFIEEYGLTFPIPVDEDGTVASKKYRVDGYPTSFLVNQEGMVTEAVFGIIDRKDLARKIDKLLE
jgi:cytochrome c biogenesis protein CcmG/thiol:disulfide interchange protein DsbE